MSATTLKIVLHGLLALVPNNTPDGANQMTVLMLDGRHSHGIECMGDHHPKLIVRASTARCAQAGCDSNGGLCVCEKALERKELRLEIEPTPNPPRRVLPKDPPRAIPRNRQEAAELGYVANVARPPFNLTLNQEYLLVPPPPNLFARLTFSFDTITACNLAKRFDGGEAYVHALGSRPLGQMWGEGEASQAMAQLVVANIIIPDAGAAGPTVTLHLKNLDGVGETELPLLPSGPNLYLIDFSNATDALPVGHSCDDGIARHFPMYYALALSAPPPAGRLVPHVRLTQSKSADALDLQACEIPTAHLYDRPICPLAIFNP